MTSVELPPIVLKVALPCPPGRAFEYFTRDIGRWWPLARFSCAREDAEGVTFEPRAGGGLIERARDGARHRWGTVVTWDPPRRLAFTWHPGRDAAEATRVELAFAPAGAGCVVTLTHGGFDVLGERALKVKREYANGWPAVFGERYPAWCVHAEKGATP